jgi:putative heme-binding domain-containing protein
MINHNDRARRASKGRPCWRGGLVLVAFTIGSTGLRADNIQHGLRVPPGFEVTEFAGSNLANDIYCLTLDPQGRVVVSGRGYIRVLVDDDNDGRADRAVEVAAAPKDGAMGLLWEGEWLYFTGDGGLRRFHIKKGTAKADGPSELIRALKTGGEHDAHAIRRGPDGWLYVLCGNMTKVAKAFAQLPTSPVKDPVAGCVLRFSPDSKKTEIVADGYRNAYGMDFNRDGELFTFDSDNERCVSLPWYEPIRFYHVMAGGHYGWLAPQRGTWWRFPPYFSDVVAPVATFGRGSPTGVACYRHVQFPKRYRGGMFLLDWTFGRVYFVKLEKSGSTYTCRKELFLEAVGDNGFAPTALAVHPKTGDLYISIGGRGTRGAVYRIRYPKGFKSLDRKELARIARVTPRSLDWRSGLDRTLLQQVKGSDIQERNRALAAVARHHGHFKSEQLREVVHSNWDHADRYVRKAAADLIPFLSKRDHLTLAREVKTPAQNLTFGVGNCTADPSDSLARAAAVLAGKTNSAGLRLAAVRLMQTSLGDLIAPRLMGTVWEGYSLRRSFGVGKAHLARAVTALRHSFPSGNADLDREVSRTLAVLEDDDPTTLIRVIRKVTAKSHPVEDIHYLIVLARLRGPRPAAVTKRTAAALVALDAKLDRRRLARDNHWPLRVAELHEGLAQQDPRLNEAILLHPDFGRPTHAIFAGSKGFNRRKAAVVFLARARREEDYAWTPALVRIIASLPDEQALPVLRSLWGKGGLEETILPFLARRPRERDREMFLSGLQSPQLATVRRCLEALEKLPPRKEGAVFLPLVKCLRRLGDGKEERLLKKRLTGYLRKLTGQSGLGVKSAAWSRWFTKAYPKLAAKLGGADGVDVAAWDRRLAKVDWSAGEAGRGKKVFVKASCASCHSGGQALGPDLRGVAGRFSRRDLFTAIVQPSKDVSPRYRTTQVTTADGKVYQGLVIYEAVGSLILQTGPDKTIRIANKQIEDRRTTLVSLMPVGLIDKLTDREIADLYAYLKSLGKAPRPKKNPK